MSLQLYSLAFFSYKCIFSLIFPTIIRLAFELTILTLKIIQATLRKMEGTINNM